MIEIAAELTDAEALEARQLPRVVCHHEGLAGLLNLLVRDTDGRVRRLGDVMHPCGRRWSEFVAGLC